MSLLLQGVKVMLRITLRGPLAVEEESLNQDKPHLYKPRKRQNEPSPAGKVADALIRLSVGLS